MFIIMKKRTWRFLIGFLLLCSISKAQFPVKNTIGGTTTQNVVPGMLSVDRVLRVPRVDTTTSLGRAFSGALTYSPSTGRLLLSNGTTWSIVTDRPLSVQQPLSVTNDVLSVDTTSNVGVATKFDVGGGINNFYFDATNRRLGIQTQTPQGILDLSSTSSAFLPPRMTKAQRGNIANPVAGMVIYQTDAGNNGLRVYNGTAWEKYTATPD